MKKRNDLNVIEVPIEDLIPYANNARTHSDEQIAQIASSIKEFGWTNPILIDADNGVIAGHGRLAAARKLKMDKIPAISLKDLSESQKKALIIADNKLALNSGWDDKLLKIELSELKDLNYEMKLTGFSDDELAEIFGAAESDETDDDVYSKKTDAPTYTPSDEKPPIVELYDEERYQKLVAEIRAADLSAEDQDFLLLAAARHVAFNYEKIADYYAHATPELQALMENSALVIIDFNKAIELGYVALSEKINKLYSKDYPNEAQD